MRRLASYAPEVAIAAIAIALRLALFVAVEPWDPQRLGESIFVGDAPDYHRLAVNLVEHGVYSSQREPPYRPNTFRVPGYPALVASVYALTGPRPHHAILVQIVLAGLACVVACRAGTLVFGRRAGLAAGSILAVDYTAVLFANRLYADTLFMLAVTASVWALARWTARPSWRNLALAGVLLALATLCRPVSLFVVAAAAPLLWIRSQGRIGLALARWGFLLGCFLLALTPWMLRNWKVSGRFQVTSMQESIADWYLPRSAGNPRFVKEAPRPLPTRIARDVRGFVRGAVRYFTILGSGELPLILGLEYGRHDAVALRDASLAEWVAATLRNRSSPFERTVVVGIALYLAALYAAAGRGVWLAVRERRWTETALLLSLVAYFVVATGPIAREVRYRMPALPAIVIFAGLGLTTPRRGGGAEATKLERAARAA